MRYVLALVLTLSLAASAVAGCAVLFESRASGPADCHPSEDWDSDRQECVHRGKGKGKGKGEGRGRGKGKGKGKGR